MAHACNLTDPEGSHKRILSHICAKLETNGMADMDWNESNIIQASYKELGEKRYKIDLECLGKIAHKSKESETIICLGYMCLSAFIFL